MISFLKPSFQSGTVPSASFDSLVDMLAIQALTALNAFPDQQNEDGKTDLVMARYFAGLIEVLFEKFSNHLDGEELRHLEQVVALVNEAFDAQVE